MTQERAGPTSPAAQRDQGRVYLLAATNKRFRDWIGHGGVLEKVGLTKIQQFHQVEPEFLEFLIELRGSADYASMDGEELFKRLDDAGFGDFFYCPSPLEWRELRKGKLPNLDSELTWTLPLDTLYSLLAVADFMNFQDRMDEMIRASIEHLFTSPVAAAS